MLLFGHTRNNGLGKRITVAFAVLILLMLTQGTKAQNIVLKDLRLMMTPDTIIKIDTSLTVVRNLAKGSRVEYKLAFTMFNSVGIDKVRLRIENPNNGNVIFSKRISYSDFNVRPRLKKAGPFHVVLIVRPLTS